jgi:integrase
MPKTKAKLTETQIKNAKTKPTAYKLYDEGGLLLLVRPSGTKVWQLPYRLSDKYNVYTIGQYPEIGSADARRLKDEAKKLIKAGTDPNKHKEEQFQRNLGAAESTFEAIGREWHGKQTWNPKHSKNILNALEKDVFPKIGYKQVNKVTAQDILSVLHGIETRDALDVAKRVNQRCVAIFDYAIAKSLCEFNPAIGRTKTLKTQEVKHRPSLRENQLPDFMKKLEDYRGGMIVRLALKLLLLTFVRPGELRWGRWDEIDEKKAEWRIPAERMKMKRPHIVPLSKQALAVLKELREKTGRTDLLFPGERGADKPISDVTLIKALIIMGYTGDKKVVPHGMRHTASTILHENKFKSEIIEVQLAHIDKNKVRGAYNHALYLEERQQLMQWWADYLDTSAKKEAVTEPLEKAA